MCRKVLVCCLMFVAVIVLFSCVYVGESVSSQLGLYVREDGVVMHEGQEFRGIGVNYFDAFYRTLKRPWDTSYHQGFEVLSEYGIPFVRFMAAGFWPSENRLYFQDREAYFQRLDGVFAAAEEFGIGLIPSLFWYYANVPDLMDEPTSAWGDVDSKTHAFMKQYIREIAQRYGDSPALWGWEFGNEFNLKADLPNADQHRPAVWENLGTRLVRGPEDDITHEMMRTAFTVFAQEVRKHDQHRLITSGNSLPRPSAWHQMTYLTWQQDSLEQFREMLLDDCPDPMDSISIHVYGQSEGRFGRQVPVAELIGIVMDISRDANKPLFIGEFGANQQTGHETAKQTFAAMVDAIVAERVPLAALWVYDFGNQSADWNVTATNARAYQLELIEAANRQLSQ